MDEERVQFLKGIDHSKYNSTIIGNLIIFVFDKPFIYSQWTKIIFTEDLSNFKFKRFKLKRTMLVGRLPDGSVKFNSDVVACSIAGLFV